MSERGKDLKENTSIVEVENDDEMKAFLETEGPKLLDLYADWCAPCNQIAPILDELAQEYFDKVKFAKANIDEIELAREMMKKFEVLGVPAVLIMGNGKGGFLVGARTKEEYEGAIEEILEKGVGG